MIRSVAHTRKRVVNRRVKNVFRSCGDFHQCFGNQSWSAGQAPALNSTASLLGSRGSLTLTGPHRVITEWQKYFTSEAKPPCYFRVHDAPALMTGRGWDAAKEKTGTHPYVNSRTQAQA